jgi:hypothetical protein
VSFEVREVVSRGDGSYLFNNIVLDKQGEGLSVDGLVGKDVSALGWGIDMLVVFKDLP